MERYGFWQRIYLISLCVLCLVIHSKQSNVPLEQVQALQAFFDAANGTYWEWKYPLSLYGNIWNFTSVDVDPCDDWQGVKCSVTADGNFTISNITLSDYNLSGTLSASLVNISSLEILELNFNSIG
eukprot:gene42737-52222_t